MEDTRRLQLRQGRSASEQVGEVRAASNGGFCIRHVWADDNGGGGAQYLEGRIEPGIGTKYAKPDHLRSPRVPSLMFEAQNRIVGCKLPRV